MNSLRLNTIYASIQGEATFTGTPAWFVRLQGCSVGCPWCDTKETWKVEDSNEVLSVPVIVQRLMENTVIRHVVITGGEPFEQPDGLFDLAAMLGDSGYVVQIETSGTTERPPWFDEIFPWITLSPKLNMPGGTVQQWAIYVCDEIKFPVACSADISKLIRLKQKTDAPIWLQPVWVKDEAKRQQIVAMCVNACMEHNLRLSLQTHRFAGLR